MSEPRRLSPAPPARPSLDYAALREAGLERIRELAAETWTDHNVHDPGITLLEAFCFAMTELGFRIQLDLADLLRSGAANAPDAPDALVPAHRVLPAGPVTPEDLRRLLLDNPRVADALITLGARGEVLFYEAPTAAPPAPPFSYKPAGPLARPRGLYEVMITFAEADLNSNTYTETVSPGGVTHTLDLALPHWDERAAAPFRGGATATTVQMEDLGSGVFWQPLNEPLSFLGKLQVQAGSAGTVELWILLRIVDDLRPPGSVIQDILAAARDLVQKTDTGSLIDRFTRRVKKAQEAADQIHHFLKTRRNLCEEPVRLAAARVQEIAVGARIEVTGGTDLEALLADVFLAIDRHLAPPVRFHSLQEMRDRGRSVEEIFDGPLLRHGFLDRDELAGLAHLTVLYTSDILRLIMRRRTAAGSDLVAQENPSGRDIVAVTNLRLSNFVNNRPVTTDARGCLQLVGTDRYRPRLSLLKSRIVFVRDDVEVPYDRARVRDLFETGRRKDRESALPADPSPVLPVPAGEALPIDDYTPFQNDLPSLYGLGEAGLPASASVERRAQVLQARGYLHLFEQFLADATAQLGHLNHFFSPRADETATFFTFPLFDLPGVSEILKRFPPGGDWQAFIADDSGNPHRSALQEAAESRDRFLDRRNRMLDHLLARQGEETVALGQELHRQARSELTAAGLPPADLEKRMAARRQAVNERLIQIKAAFLAEAPELAALRLQAFGTPLPVEQSLTPMERRIRHLTGIRSGVRRRLALPDQLFEILNLTGGDGTVDGWRLHELPVPSGAVLLASVSSFTAATDAEALALARRSIEETAHFGLNEWSYEISPAAPPFAVELRNPAGTAIAKPQATFASRESAQQAIDVIVALLRQLQDDAEGFHLVEHLLLRPRQEDDKFLGLPGENGQERDPYSQRLTLVFPSGQARDFSSDNSPRQPSIPYRFRDPEFRRHAERMVRQSCPAHLLPTILWVDHDLATAPSPASFQGFESRYFAWLGTVLVPGGDPTAVGKARNDLVAALNAIANG